MNCHYRKTVKHIKRTMGQLIMIIIIIIITIIIIVKGAVSEGAKSVHAG